MYTFIYLYIMCLYAVVFNGKWKTEAQVIFLNLLTICSLCKRKFVVCPFVYKEINGSYPFAYGLNGLNRLIGINGLAHLWLKD